MNKKITNGSRLFNLSQARYYNGKTIKLSFRDKSGFKKFYTIKVNLKLVEIKKPIPRLNIKDIKIYSISPDVLFFKHGKDKESRVYGFERGSNSSLVLEK